MAGNSHRRHRIGLAAAIIFFFIVLAPVWAWVVEPRLLLVREVTVTSAEVPPEFDGVRIAFLTDIHRGPAVSEERVREVVKKTNALAPDIVVLGGDYTSAGPGYIASGISPLAGLRAPLGKFAVLGNHDYWYSAHRTRAALSAAGISEIENQGVWVEATGAQPGGTESGPGTPESGPEGPSHKKPEGPSHKKDASPVKPPSRIRVAGVGDLWEAKQDLAAALADARPSDFVILLSHNPDYTLKLPDGAVDLVLCGHTHGGQVTLFGLWAPVLPLEGPQRLRSGVTAQGAATVIVSRGIGLIAPHVRFCCPPEVVVVTLRRK